MGLMTLTIAIIINALLDIAILGALAFTTSRGAKLVDLSPQPTRLKAQSAQRDRRAEPTSAVGHRASAA
jgi:hypothetical protein